jgi:hypothetical protein
MPSNTHGAEKELQRLGDKEENEGTNGRRKRRSCREER